MENRFYSLAGVGAPPSPVISVSCFEPVVKDLSQIDPHIIIALFVGAFVGVILSRLYSLLGKAFSKRGAGSEVGKEGREAGYRHHDMKCNTQDNQFSEKIDDLQKKLKHLADSRRDSLLTNDSSKR